MALQHEIDHLMASSLLIELSRLKRDLTRKRKKMLRSGEEPSNETTGVDLNRKSLIARISTEVATSLTFQFCFRLPFRGLRPTLTLCHADAYLLANCIYGNAAHWLRL